MTLGDTVIRVEVTNADGVPTGQIVPVCVTYVLERHYYGADADGQRGEWREDLEVIGIDIAHYDLRALNSDQVEALIVSARRHVLARDFRPSLLTPGGD